MDKKRILLVDDEKDLSETVVFQLQISGYEVSVAHDGQEGLEKARKEKPDLIILDLMLPKVDGYWLCGLLKSDIRYSKIPIIIFTARAQESDIRLAKEVGAEAYITKPFEQDVLMGKIKELLKE